jgi:hypothetical protein
MKKMKKIIIKKSGHYYTYTLDQEGSEIEIIGHVSP